MNLRPVPPASFESAESVAAFITHFEDSEPSRTVKAIGFPIMAALLPRVGYDLGAPQEITEHLDDDGLIYVMPDHKERFDIPVHTAAAYRSRSLHRILRNLDIESQPENFALHPVASVILRELGADGVVRTEDLRNPRFGTPPDRVEEFKGITMPLQMAISAKHINSGRHHATYWTGGRRGKKGRPMERLAPKDVKPGVLERLEAIEDPDNVKLVFSGINYSEAFVVQLGRFGLPFGVSVTFSRPHAIPKDRDAMRELIAGETQKCDDAAAWMAKTLPPGPGVRVLRSVVESETTGKVIDLAGKLGHLVSSAKAA